MPRLLLFFILFIFSLPLKGVDETYTAGGWVTVKSVSSGKYEVVCNLLYNVSGYKNQYGIPTHAQLAAGDTNVYLRVYDSSGNYYNLTSKYVRGYYYTQKDTSNTQVSSGVFGEFFVNKYYRLIFKCTLDLNNSIVKSSINVNSSYLDFTCDFTGETWCKLDNWHMNSLGCVSPTSTTRVYLKNLPTSVNTLEPSHVAFTKIMDYSAKNYYATNYYNPGFYVPYGDSIKVEMIEPQTSIKNIKSIKYNNGISGSAPFYTYCKDSSNTCAASPNANPPQGFYFNSLTSDIVFCIFKYPQQSSQFAIRCHHYHKATNGRWLYMGYTTLSQNMTTNHVFGLNLSNPYINGTIFPTFSLPTNMDLCEGDSQTISIKTQVTKAIHKYTASLDGNFPNASVSTDYSSGNSTPTFRIKMVAKTGDYSSVPGVVTLRVHADSNWVFGEAARSVPVYVHKPIIPVIAIAANGCNNLKGILKSVNTDVPVKVTWTIHEKSPSAPAIYTTTATELLYTGLLPLKYYVKCFVMPVAATCKCTGKTVIDSLDMKKLWPGLDFGLNRNTVCLKDSSKVYFASNVKNFKSKVYYNWEVNGQAMFGLKDTLSMNFTGATTLKLTLRDDSGCMSSKTFVLPVDTIYSLQQASSLSHCGPDTLTLAATSTFSSNYWMGQYSVIDVNGSTIYTVRDSIFKYYYKEARYYVLSEFTSNNGCYTSFKTDIQIDTTQLRFKAMPKQLCKGMKMLTLSDIGATPTGGLWSHSQGNGNSVTLDKFSKYPSSFWLTYIYENASTKCLYIRSDSFWVTDTVKTNLGSVNGICKETKLWDAPSAFKSTGPGIWYNNGSGSGLTIDSTGKISPRKSSAGTYTVNKYFKNASGCDYQSEGQITIAPAVLNLSGMMSQTVGKPSLKVNFQGQNGIAGTTKYKWIFGDTKQSPKDTAWGALVSYTYNDTGRYNPRMIGVVGGCRDTITLNTITVGLLGVKSLGENLTIQLYPNPTGAGNEVVLSIEGNNKSRNIVVYNSVGSKVSSHHIEKGENRIVLKASTSGIYLIEIEGAGNQIKWVVE
ncbi:hypothetical protein LBMAG26_14550 [Bacteroidota bacterium]|nr:hypothetical protein LBMAG26_14550 [Bacteroidota bacterium]